MSLIRQRRWAFALGLLVSLAILLGCSLPGRILGQVAEGPSPEGLPAGGEAQGPVSEEGPGLAEQVERGELEVVEIVANGEISGPGMSVVIHNPGTEDITVIIPCGFFFEPVDPGAQRLMVVQPASVVVPAGGEAELMVTVVCIDATSETPDGGAAYSLGSNASGDLLKLAECACREDLSGEEGEIGVFGVMLTGWSISEGLSYEEMQAEGGEGAMGQAFGEGMGGLIEMLGGFSTDWYDRCDIPRPE